MNSFETFLQLHQNPSPLLLGNVWDVNSAKIFEGSNYKAIGTSSAAVANSFGYNDGQQLPFDLLVQLSKRIVEVVHLPLSVDIEGGYSATPSGIIDNIERLHQIGVVGVNLEDTYLADAKRQMRTGAAFQKILSVVTDHFSKTNAKIFFNIRTDAFLLGLPNALEETLARIKMYETCGIHGIFVPCIINTQDIKEVVASTPLPLNVMSMPELPSLDELASLGVKRISMGNAVHNFLTAVLEKTLAGIDVNKSFKGLY